METSYKTKIAIGIDEINTGNSCPEVQSIYFSLREWFECCSFQELTSTHAVTSTRLLCSGEKQTYSFAYGSKLFLSVDIQHMLSHL